MEWEKIEQKTFSPMNEGRTDWPNIRANRRRTFAIVDLMTRNRFRALGNANILSLSQLTEWKRENRAYS